MSKKKIIIIVCCVIAALGLALGIFFFIRKKGLVKKSDTLVYVESVRSITGVSLGNSSRFMGIVESQESKSVQKDSDKSVKEVYVKEGDIVKKGDKLFSYDTSEMELNLEQLNLERQAIQNTINSLTTSINDYTAQRGNATDEDDILSYTSQINSSNSSLKEEEYNLSTKDLEIKKMQESIEKAVVTAPMNGMIKTIGKWEGSSGSSEGGEEDDFAEDLDYEYDSGESESLDNSNAFITIIAEGDYRVRAITDEMNIHSFTSGTPIIIRSRVDEKETWKGTVAKVDMEPRKNESGDDYYSESSGESASKYNFYVNPENTDNMILGQHLFIELDNGQEDAKEGIHLPAYYLVKEGDNFFVWKRGEEDRIVRAKVDVGEFDEDANTYEITGGLKMEDYIAFPDDYVEEGCMTTTNIDDIEEETGLTDMASDGDAMDMDMMEEFPEEDMATSPDALIDESMDMENTDMGDDGMSDIEDNGDMFLGGDDTDVGGVDIDDSEDYDDSEDADDSEDDFDLE